jgi:hypothetical protein
VVRRIFRALLILAALGAFAFLVACGGSSHNNSGTGGGGGGSANNVQSIAVDGGPVVGQIYPDGAFTSVTLCVPGSSTCQTVDGILVDTGSYGLRLLASTVSSLNLPILAGSGGTSYYNCVSFVDRAFLWGAVGQADIEMAGEKASNTSVQLIGDPTGFAVPTACSNGGVDEDNQAGLGTNGILGVGPYPEDCGPACATGNPPPVYFTCLPSGSCQPSLIPVAQQIANPVARFATDNNGVILEMQSVDVASATASGAMIFGIGTQSNNALGSAAIFPINSSGFFTTSFNQQTMNESFIDSGSNGFFFPDSSIPQCAQNSIAPGFYCPTSTLNLSAQNTGQGGAQSTVNFSVDNAVTEFQSTGSDAAFSELAGPNGSDICSGQGTCGFDWGLPFFYGRNVFTAISGQSVPSGAPAAPWWAY